jgi:hypothetical protein
MRMGCTWVSFTMERAGRLQLRNWIASTSLEIGGTEKKGARLVDANLYPVGGAARPRPTTPRRALRTKFFGSSGEATAAVPHLDDLRKVVDVAPRVAVDHQEVGETAPGLHWGVDDLDPRCPLSVARSNDRSNREGYASPLDDDVLASFGRASTSANRWRARATLYFFTCTKYIQPADPGKRPSKTPAVATKYVRPPLALPRRV